MVSVDYNLLKVIELRKIAKERGLKGYSTLLKTDLIELLKKDDTKKLPKKKTPMIISDEEFVSGFIATRTSPVESKKTKPSITLEERVLSPKLDKKMKNTFKITPSLAFIYQISQPENSSSLPAGFGRPSFIFTYEDAIECTNDINSSKWNLVNKYLDQFEKEAIKRIYHRIDKTFLLDLLKKETLEHQRGNITFLHSKNLSYLILDIISQLISGSYEGFKPKCLRKEEEIDKKALDIVKQLFELPDVKSSPSKDHHPSVRKRLISTNSTIFNNAFSFGESTLQFLFSGSVLEPTSLLSRLNLDYTINDFIIKLMGEIKKIGKHLIVMYSIPIDKLEKYVYPSQPYGEINLREKNIYKNLENYLSKTLWKTTFEYNYSNQYRIVDLCYTKYGYKDNVRIYQMTDIPVDTLENFITKIEKQLNEWIINYVDVAISKQKQPLKSIASYRSKKFILPFEESLNEDLERISPKMKGSKDKEEVPDIAPEIILYRGEESIPERDIVILPAVEEEPFLLAPSDIAEFGMELDKGKHPVKIIYTIRTVAELRKIAKDRGLKGYSKLKKDELITFLKKHEKD